MESLSMNEDSRMSRPVLVVGAGRPLGQAIVDELRSGGQAVIATLRTPQTEAERRLRATGAEVRLLDLEQPCDLAGLMAGVRATIALARVPLAGEIFLRAALPPGTRCVFFSSHNAAVDFSTPAYDQFRAAEAAIQASTLAWTILRPTMIYGFSGDGNISRLVSGFRRLPFAVMPSGGTARMQPVYYRDLARVAAAVVDIAPTVGQILEVGGPDRLSLKEIYRAAADGKPVVALPLTLVQGAARAAAALRLPFPLSAAQLARASLDRLPRTPECLPEAYRPQTPFSVVIKILLRETVRS
jgi:uncharacterized protein YbjT (DUF2867 family)